MAYYADDLVMAAANGEETMVSSLLQAKGNANIASAEGCTPVWIAAQNGKVGALEILLSSRGNPDMVDSNGASSVHIAASKQEAAALRLLLEAKGTANLADNEGTTPVLQAAQNGWNGCVDVLRLLLEANGNPNKVRGSDDISPVLIASTHGDVGTLKLLLHAKGDPNIVRSGHGDFPVFVAAQKGLVDALQVLLESRADVNAFRQSDRVSPVFKAAEKGHVEILKLLLAAGGNPNQERDTRSTPVFVASQERDCTRAMKLLLEAKGNPNHANLEGKTPFYWPAYENRAEAMKILIDAKGNPGLVAGDGQTPIDIAREHGCQDVIEFLQPPSRQKVTPAMSSSETRPSTERDKLMLGRDVESRVSISSDQKVNFLVDMLYKREMMDTFAGLKLEMESGRSKQEILTNSKLGPKMRADKERIARGARQQENYDCGVGVGDAQGGEQLVHATNAALDLPVIKMEQTDWIFTGMVGFLAFGLVLIMCVWAKAGLMEEDHIGHLHSLISRVGHMHSPIFSTPQTISLHGTEKRIFDVRIIGMALADFSHISHGAGHRRLDGSRPAAYIDDGVDFDWVPQPRRIYRRLAEVVGSEHVTTLGIGRRVTAADHAAGVHDTGTHSGDSHGTGAATLGDDNTHGDGADGAGNYSDAQGGAHAAVAQGHDAHAVHHVCATLTYKLLADGVAFHENTIALRGTEEYEYFETITLPEDATYHKNYAIEVTSSSTDHLPVAFMCQVIRMSGAAAYRFHIGIITFILTFASIVAEKIHRSYSALIGSSVTLCVLAAIQETPELHHVTAMIEFGTLMLLFSMMILMQMLAMTGFFNWFALKVIILSDEKPDRLFFMLTNICGFMSMFLDNVTCVLLTGPLTYQICSKMQLNPRWLYLSMTICATVGGTATYIGDPPNIVIGGMLEVGFISYIYCNFPLIAFFCLPLCSSLLYWRFKDHLCRYEGGVKPELDRKKLIGENQITDEPMFYKLGVVLFGVLIALVTSPIHYIEPAWFTMMAMMVCAVLFDRHHMGTWLEFVEWDTLFFFALLFVFVEALSELGVIRILGEAIISFIMMFSEGTRETVAILVILWVSGIGSAFLESLPYTTTMIYIIKDLLNTDIPGVNVRLLIWPLSVGACCGGIGSIMGSSANLVCMAISGRCADCDEDKVHGSDFLKYGLPALIAILIVATGYLLLLFEVIGFNPEPDYVSTGGSSGLQCPI